MYRPSGAFTDQRGQRKALTSADFKRSIGLLLASNQPLAANQPLLDHKELLHGPILRMQYLLTCGIKAQLSMLY